MEKIKNNNNKYVRPNIRKEKIVVNFYTSTIDYFDNGNFLATCCPCGTSGPCTFGCCGN